MDQERIQAYLRRNVRLMAILMILWAVFSLGAAAVSRTLNSVVFGGFPLGYYMGAQGALTYPQFLRAVFGSQRET